MRELVLQVIKALVDHPEEAEVKSISRNDHTLLEITVNQEDVGKIIGKQGRIIKAIRTVVKSWAAHNNQKISVEIANQ